MSINKLLDIKIFHMFNRKIKVVFVVSKNKENTKN